MPLPRDAYKDDPTIGPDELIYRLIKTSFAVWKELNDEGYPRLSKQGFQDYPESGLEAVGVPARAMSVGLGSALEELGLDPSVMMALWGEDYGLAVLTASDVRACGQGIVRWPTTREPWHAMVFSLEGPQKNKAAQSNLAAAASWVLVPRAS